MKNPKWRIGVSFSTHHIIELEAPSAEEACALALESCESDKEGTLTAYGKSITSVLVNDREAREFAVYVPEFYVRRDEK